MRPPVLTTLAVCLVVAALAAAVPADAAFPARVTAPYLWTGTDTNLTSLSNSTGNKWWTLAFIRASSSGACTPTWVGTTALTGNNYGSSIAGLRANGGDVIVSFGGASGSELGLVCTSVSSLQAAYQQVISQFGLTSLDFDIESTAETTASVDRRNKAIHNLQVANPGLVVSYTLPLNGDRHSGLLSTLGGAPSGLPILQNALANGVTVNVVNIMAMDYGSSHCYTDMGQAAVDQAVATRAQLASIGLSAKVGVTPMIGQNDTACEFFSTTDASVLVNYAYANSYISRLAYWVQGADTNNQYVNIFKAFNSTSATSTPTPTRTATATATSIARATATPTTGSSTNLARGKVATSSGTLSNGARITDGDKTSANYASTGSAGAQWIQIDLGQSYSLKKVNLWHYFADGRTYHDVIVKVSTTADFSSGVTTVFNNDTSNAVGVGAGTNAEYAETAGGKTITFAPVMARYVKLWTNGSTVNAYNHYVEVEVFN